MALVAFLDDVEEPLGPVKFEMTDLRFRDRGHSAGGDEEGVE